VSCDFRKEGSKISAIIEDIDFQFKQGASGFQGSRLDLRRFDDFNIATQVAFSTLPVINAVGHFEDISIADEVSFHPEKKPTAAISNPLHRGYALVYDNLVKLVTGKNFLNEPNPTSLKLEFANDCENFHIFVDVSVNGISLRNDQAS